jgi:hypothetical protein
MLVPPAAHCGSERVACVSMVDARDVAEQPGRHVVEHRCPVVLAEWTLSFSAALALINSGLFRSVTK